MSFFFSTPLTYKYTPKKTTESCFPSHQASLNSSVPHLTSISLLLINFSDSLWDCASVDYRTIRSRSTNVNSLFNSMVTFIFFFFFICLWHCSLLASGNFLLVFCDSKFFWLSCCLWVFFPPPKSQLLSSLMDFPGGASGKEPACQCRLAITDMSSIPRSGRSPRGGHSNPLQYSCLENPMDRGARQTAAHGVTKSDVACMYVFPH